MAAEAQRDQQAGPEALDGRARHDIDRQRHERRVQSEAGEPEREHAERKGQAREHWPDQRIQETN
jgi:hypothetical protein